ncbi:MAG: hypothetical protein LBB98_07895 [Treponema sp.]|jgi:pyruvate/2-oxoglutarate/acetoin dehydrogenase E1 component|nr:hypothetical protein [Treponema sp.]
MSVKTYAMAIRDILAEEMRRDPEVFIMGEDIARQGASSAVPAVCWKNSAKNG